MANKTKKIEQYTLISKVLTVVFAALSIVWLFPIFEVVINSFKENSFVNLNPFALPNEESYVGFANYIKGMTFGNYPFLQSVGYSLLITVASVALILLCCSMSAWYIARVKSAVSNIFYYLCLFSMIVPFQMVMFTLSKLANMLHLNTPLGIVIIYLGFGAGLAVFMFSGYMKSCPIAIEESAMIDGCSPPRTFFSIVLPILQPTYVSTAILEAMWIWNDYLLPYLVLDIKKYKTIPIAVQYLKGGYGSVDMGAMMAMLVLAIIPIIVLYLACQKFIISGVMAGAVKG